MDDARCFATAVYGATARSALAAADVGARMLGVYQAAAVLTHGPDYGGCGGLVHWSTSCCGRFCPAGEPVPVGVRIAFCWSIQSK